MSDSTKKLAAGVFPSNTAGAGEVLEQRHQEIVDAWQDAFEQGRELDVAELCQGHPDLLDKVQQHIDVLRKMGKLAKFSTIGNAAENPDPPTSEDLNNRPTCAGMAGSRSLQELLRFFSAPKAAGELGRLGDYAILGLLGEGGMGAVFVAEDPMLKRRVALKVMRPEVAANPMARERFLREAQSAAKLQNDHIVPIFHVGQEKLSGMWFITMPLLQGETLEQRMRRGPPLSAAEVMKIGREVAQGLSAAHAMNLIHRDIKPANLWLEARPADKDSHRRDSHDTMAHRTFAGPGTEFRLKILDFGLARPTVTAEEMTGSGAFLGTPGFMSPEQIDSLTLDGRTDLFSLGCVLYRAATGASAFQAVTLTALLRATAEQEPPPPHTLNPLIPLAFSQLIMRLLQKKPEARYATGEELLAAFDVLASMAHLTLPAYAAPPGLLTDRTGRLRAPPATGDALLPPAAVSAPKFMVVRFLFLLALVIGGLVFVRYAPAAHWLRDQGRQLGLIPAHEQVQALEVP